MTPRLTAAQKAAKTLPTNYLFCRAFQHSWGDELFPEWDKDRRIWAVYLVCTRCDMRRPVRTTHDGYLAEQWRGGYQQPRDYRVPTSEAILNDKDGRAAVRAELIARKVREQSNVRRLRVARNDAS